MLQALPAGWCSWNYQVRREERLLTTIDVAWLRERGMFTLGGAEFFIERERWWGDFLLSAGDEVVCRAKKPSALRRRFHVTFAGGQYVLEAASIFSRTFALRQQRRKLGVISPAGWFTRRAQVAISDEVPLPVQVFLLWLVVILWRRAENSK